MFILKVVVNHPSTAPADAKPAANIEETGNVSTAD